MKRFLVNIFQLGIKELFSLRYDPVMLLLIVFMFSFSVIEDAQNATSGVVNAAVAIVDEDRSQLSRRIGDALMPPYFQPPVAIAVEEIDANMEAARFAFVIDIPPGFQADLMSGRPTTIQLNVDATVMGLAGTGAAYIQQIISQELSIFLNNDQAAGAVNIVTRAKFNPNMETKGFQGAMSLTNNITMMTILLTGAALIREREHGTIEHLLVMPLTPFQIMAAKVWSNGLVVLVVAALSLWIVVQGTLAMPVAGSIPLFLFAAMLHLFSTTALGILLATIARSMPQFALLMILVVVPLNMLSGTNAPTESMPLPVQSVMLAAPTTHFVSLSQAILFRGAGLDVVWPQLLAIAGIGGAFFTAALLRFRRTVTLTQG